MKQLLTGSFIVAAAIAAAPHLHAQAPAGLPKAPPTAPASRWRVVLSKSPMDDSQTVVVSLDADAPVRVWLKSVTPTLMVRCKEKALDVYVVTHTAANVEQGDSRTVRIRFNTAAAEVHAWSESTDHDALFSDAPANALNKMLSTSKLLFEFTPFNAPPVIVSFSASGFSAFVNRLRAACSDDMVAVRDAEARKSDPRLVDLVGAKAADVEARLGTPDLTASDGQVWTYTVDGGALHLFLDSAQSVARVDAPTYSIKDFKTHRVSLTRQVSASAAVVPAAPQTLDSLVGKTPADVRALIGEPTEIAGARWTFQTVTNNTIHVYFTSDGTVSEVQPKQLAVRDVKVSDKAPVIANTEPRQLSQSEPSGPVPTGAVAKCTDGAYVLVDVGTNTCAVNGGVAQWYGDHK
jgi:type VI secretion system protein VasI